VIVRIQKKLASWGLIGADKIAASKPLSVHLEEWEDAVLAQGSTAKHAKSQKDYVTEIFNACGFVYFSEVSEDVVLKKIISLNLKKIGVPVHATQKSSRPGSFVSGWLQQSLYCTILFKV